MWKKLWAWMCDEDWVIIAIPATILAGLLFCLKLYYILGMLLSIGGIVLLWEWIAVQFTGKSISDQFREWKKTHQVAGWIVLTAISATCWALIVHFAVNIK